MPKIARWDNLPANVRQHLVERLRDRSISIADLNQLRLWTETQPEVPEGIGIRTSVHSKYAATAPIPRRSCFRAKLPRASPFSPTKHRFAAENRRIPDQLRLVTVLIGLVNAEVQARDGSSDHVLLNLNEVAVGIRHGQHREHVLAARNHYEFS